MAGEDLSDLADGLLLDWGWMGFPGGVIHDLNAFGAILCRDPFAQVWVISPADLEAYQISEVPFQLDEIWDEAEFQDGWKRADFARHLSVHHGPLGPGQIYALQIPISLGGTENAENYRIEDATAYSRRMGELAAKLHAAGDGCEVHIDDGVDGPPVIEPVI